MSADRPGFDERSELEERILTDVATYERPAIAAIADRLTPGMFADPGYREIWTAALADFHTGRADRAGIAGRLNTTRGALFVGLIDPDAEPLADGGESLRARVDRLRAIAEMNGKPGATAPSSAWVVTPLEEFAATEEQGASALLGDPDEAVIPEGGDVMFYGDGGAGKTTLSIDLACHLAAGDPWLAIPVTRPLRVLLVENEGPRPLYRRKLQRKLEGWAGSPLERRVRVMEAPWASVSFADCSSRQALAHEIEEHEVDVVVAGPVARSGMNEAGTLQEVRDFMGLVAEVRRLAGRAVTFILIHHENKGGKVSGAWEGSGDTLLHVSAQRHGSTRLDVQKARWSSRHHGTTLTLVWVGSDGFALAEAAELDDETLAGLILAEIARTPGAGWTRVEEATPGVQRQRRRDVRDRLLRAGTIVNIAKIEGVETWLDECPERKTARLYLANDLTIQHLRPASGADGAQTAPPQGAGIRSTSAPCAPPLEGRRGVGADPHPDVEPLPLAEELF